MGNWTDRQLQREQKALLEDILANQHIPGGPKVIYTQTEPATTWVIDHNLGHNPAVTVITTEGQLADPVLEYVTLNRTLLNFGAQAVAGTAYLT